MGLDLGWLLALVIVGLVIWKEGNRILAPVIGPLFALLGRAYGATVGHYLKQRHETELQQSDQRVSALESQSTQSEQVSNESCTDLELVWIAYELGRGSKPSAIAKTLPGYSSRDYEKFTTKVDEVESLLAQKVNLEDERAERKAAKLQSNRAGTAMIQEQSV